MTVPKCCMACFRNVQSIAYSLGGCGPHRQVESICSDDVTSGSASAGQDSCWSTYIERTHIQCLLGVLNRPSQNYGGTTGQTRHVSRRCSAAYKVMDRCHSLYRPAHTKQSIHECMAIGCNQIAQQVKRGRGRGGGRSIRAGTRPL